MSPITLRDAAAVESHALAHEHHGRFPGLAALVADHDQPGRFLGAGGDGEERTHLQPAQFLLVQHLHLDGSMLLGQLAGLAGEVGGRADVGRQVGQVARQRHAGPDAPPVVQPVFGGLHLAPVGDRDREGLEGCRWLLARAADRGNPVQRCGDRLGGEPPEVVAVGVGDRFDGQVAHGFPGAGFRKQASGRGHRLAVLLAPELALLAEPDHQDPLYRALFRMQQRGLRGLAAQVAALDEPAEQAAHGPVEFGCCSPELARLVDSDDCAIAALAGRRATHGVKLHVPHPLHEHLPMQGPA
jgi:hypothetical protein